MTMTVSASSSLYLLFFFPQFWWILINLNMNILSWVLFILLTDTVSCDRSRLHCHAVRSSGWRHLHAGLQLSHVCSSSLCHRPVELWQQVGLWVEEGALLAALGSLGSRAALFWLSPYSRSFNRSRFHTSSPTCVQYIVIVKKSVHF